MSNEIITTDRNQGFMTTSTLDEAIKVSEIIAASSFCPTNMKGKPGDVMVCLQFGKELGLKPMASIQNIAVINGRPCIWGDAMLAVCHQSMFFDSIDESLDVATMTATCVVKRKGKPECVSVFSQADAKTANLWGKAGPWTQYPKRMLQMRARGFALRDAFPDILKGIIIKEEAQDYEKLPVKKREYERDIKDVGVTLDNKPEQEELINEDQIAELKQLTNELEGDLTVTCKYLRIDSVEHMSTVQWSELMRQMQKKLIEKRKVESLPINMHVQETISDDAKEFFGDESE
jgi:hypothetical protein